MRYEGMKLVFRTRVLTTAKLTECVYIHITDNHEWEPTLVHLSKVIAASNKLQTYQDDQYNEMILHSIEPTLVTLKERCI